MVACFDSSMEGDSINMQPNPHTNILKFAREYFKPELVVNFILRLFVMAFFFVYIYLDM